MWSFDQQDIFLLHRNARQFFCCIFLQFWAFLLFITILARDHMEIWFYFKYAYLKEHVSAFEKILSFRHQVILPLKHCICRIKLKFGWQHLLMADRSHDNLNQICEYWWWFFFNIYFLPCDLLGISAYFNKKMPENCIFYDFKARPLTLPIRSNDLL